MEAVKRMKQRSTNRQITVFMTKNSAMISHRTEIVHDLRGQKVLYD